MYQDLTSFRKELHAHPELSGAERATAQRIIQKIKTFQPTQIIDNLGGHGVAAIYDFPKPGKTVLLRADTDALPIQENNSFDYKSKVDGVSHKCGHDGHMAIVAGLILWIKNQSFSSGRIVLLFQPAEETGKGAVEVLADERFLRLKSDYIFALHNIPGENLNNVLLMKNGFSAEVQSFSVHLNGKESHASEPENGINPAYVITSIIGGLSELNVNDSMDAKFSVLTPVHINVGDTSYGISPGRGEIHYTIRTWSKATMIGLKKSIEDIIYKNCLSENISFEIDWFEYFPASENDADCNEYIKEVALAHNIDLIEREYPLKFGEDFGWFSRQYKTAMFGLGAGVDSPALHHADYDFPDEIIETGIRMFSGLIEKLISINE